MKFTRVFLAAAFFAGLLSLNVSAQELIENGGFESPLLAPNLSVEGNFSGFAGGGVAEPILDATAPNSGASHLSIVFNGEDNSFAGVQQVVDNIVQGATYTFDIAARTVGTFGLNAEFRIEYLDAAGNFVGDQFATNQDITTGLSDTYANFSNVSTAPTGATSLRAVFAAQSFGAGNNIGTVFADDFSLTGPVAVPEPSSLCLLSVAMVGLASRRRRR